MEKPYFKINGVDILSKGWVELEGIKWRRGDIDDDEAGRTMDSTMHRARVDIKFRADINCLDLSRADELELMHLILPEYVTVETNQHPLYEHTYAQYYSNNVPATVAYIDPVTGESRWKGISFPLIER